MKHCDSSVLSPSVLLSFKALQQAIRRILWGAPKMIKIKAISALSKTCHWSKGLKVDTHYILPQVDLSDQKIRCWQSSFFELLCLPSRSLDFQYVSMMRPTFWSRFYATNVMNECPTSNSAFALIAACNCLSLGHFSSLSSHLWKPINIHFCIFTCFRLHLPKTPSWSPNQFSHFTLNFVKFTFCLKRWAWLPNYHCIKS